ncbi:MAG: ATP-grasp domain-containing protein [Candidatus Marinimicrobia bacterium]|nr:ATP-grasp domain-containing protein [Candidatus Neomarinimicrobiota bacterium]
MSYKSQENINPVIVYNTSYNGLSIIQELGSRGISCFAFDSTYSVGAFSKYAKFRKCPNPVRNEKAFIGFLYEFCVKLPLKPILFPTNDEWALVTAKYKVKLSEVAIPCVASYKTVNTLLSKDLFYKIGQQKDYLTPQTWDFHDLDNISEKQFPIVAKPKYKSPPAEVYSQRISNNLKKTRLVLLNNKEQLKQFIEKNQGLLKHIVFQEYVQGYSDTMYTVGIYANSKHEIKALFAGRKVRGYPADIGDNVLGESHVVPEYLIQNTKKVVKELKFEGIAEFEYKRDEITEEFRLIEVNPRPWSWIGITPYCGVNIPLIAYQSLLGKNTELVQSEVKNGDVKYIKIFQDFFNCMIRYRFNYKPWHCSYKLWKKSIKARKLVVAELHKKDWGVFFASFPYLFGKILFQKWN